MPGDKHPAAGHRTVRRTTRRAGFTYQHLWVTAYDPAENATRQATTRASDRTTTAYRVTSKRIAPLDDTDVVVWYTFRRPPPRAPTGRLAGDAGLPAWASTSSRSASSRGNPALDLPRPMTAQWPLHVFREGTTAIFGSFPVSPTGPEDRGHGRGVRFGPRAVRVGHGQLVRRGWCVFHQVGQGGACVDRLAVHRGDPRRPTWRPAASGRTAGHDGGDLCACRPRRSGGAPAGPGPRRSPPNAP